MNLLKLFQDTIQEKDLFQKDAFLILAVSGGMDSVVLTELCKQSGYTCAIAHCNFKLRGEESDRDENFVKELAAKMDFPFFLKSFDTKTYATEHKVSTQVAARDLRYAWFGELVKEHTGQAVYLLTAHHADDNAENLLMNFFRGTGLRGLAGMPAKNEYIRRPLLGIERTSLQAFARENNLQWVEDSSNQLSDYTRNFFRNEMLPAIQTVFPQVDDNLQGNLRRFSEISELYTLAVAGIKKKLVRPKKGEWHIPVKQWMGYNNKALIYEIIRDFGFGEKQVEEVIKLSTSESGRFIESPDRQYRLIRHRHWFIVSPAADANAAHYIINEYDKSIAFRDGLLNVSTVTGDSVKPSSDVSEAWLDASVIEFPLLLRQAKTGDYFYPLGMKKKKKIARFLIDQKLSKTAREKTWVIESGKRIVWVVGQRLDERVKIKEATKSAIRIQLSKK
ncbi:MAG: tRNA lysidine(34) synthetase TilS [Chitinophagaceae bacterium]|nr:tRNA lysidine(34) synthetase TilS [Chitinophagaceae bacterium]